LPLILSDGALLCKSEMNRRGRVFRNIAHQTIQDRRATTAVPCCRGGCLHDYVPFYFAPRSPMLYSISRGNVAGYAEGQEPVLHLVTHAQHVGAAALPFAFTNGHATVYPSGFWDDLNRLAEVDWSVMPLIYWNDTLSDPDRKRRRQAEFLLYHACPWTIITEIGVINARMKAWVETKLQFAEHSPAVTVRRDWYY
jgi:hypothetical protein